MKKMTEEELLKAFEEIPSSNVSDALDKLKIQRRLIHGLIPMGPDQPRLVGFAYTVRHMERHPNAGDAFLLTTHKEVIDELAQPGDVLVVEMGGRIDACSGGSMLALRGQKRGMKGFIIDGGFRDGKETAALGFPVFCKALTPAKSGPHMQTVERGGAVSICGVQVIQGDLLIGDDTGIVVVPRDEMYRVFEAAEKIYITEDKMIEMIEQGASMAEAQKAGEEHYEEVMRQRRAAEE